MTPTPENFKSEDNFPEVMKRIKNSKHWQLGEGTVSKNVKEVLTRAEKLINFDDVKEFYEKRGLTGKELEDLSIADAYLGVESVLKNAAPRGEEEYFAALMKSPEADRLNETLMRTIMSSGSGLINIAVQYAAIGYALGKQAAHAQDEAAEKKLDGKISRRWNPFKKE